MRILFVTGGIPSPIGQIHVLQLLKGLSREHQVTVVAFDTSEPCLADSNEELAGLARVISVPLARRGLSARAIRSFFSLVPVAVQAFRSEAMRQALAEACRHNEYDLVILEQLVMGQYGSLVGDLPKLFFPVDAVSRFKWQRFRVAANSLKKVAFAVDFWMTRRYESRIYGKFNGVLFVSEADASYAVASYQVSPSRVFVLPLALDTGYFKPGPGEPGSCPSLVFLGNMSNHINEDAILWFHLAVWPRLKRTFPELKLYIVGNGPTRKVRGLGSGDCSIIVTAYLRDIRPPVWNATVFVAPLRVGAGIKNRILQAMAMGKAIVASPLSAEGLGVEDGREILIAGDAETFYEKVVFLLRNAEERERLAHAARRYVEANHCLEVQAWRFLEIAQQVVARKEGARYEPHVVMAHPAPRVALVSDRGAFIAGMCKGRSVLHLGCAEWPFTAESLRNGSLLHVILSRVAKRLIGIDLSTDGLSLLRARGFTDLIHWDVERLDQLGLDEPVEVIIVGELLEHLANPGLCLQGISRLMKAPSCMLIVSVPNAYSLRHFVSMVRGVERVMPDHTAYYSFATLLELLQRHGLEVSGFFSCSDLVKVSGWLRRSLKSILNATAFRAFPQLSEGIMVVARRRDRVPREPEAVLNLVKEAEANCPPLKLESGSLISATAEVRHEK